MMIGPFVRASFLGGLALALAACGGGETPTLGEAAAPVTAPLSPTALAIEGPSAIAAGGCTQVLLSLTAQGPAGDLVHTTTAVARTVQLVPTVGGSVYPSAGCATAGNTVTIPAGTDGAPFWVKVDAAGTLGLTATSLHLAFARASIEVVATGTPVGLSLGLTGGATQAPGDCRVLHLGFVDAAGNPVVSPQSTQVTLDAGSGSVSFFYGSACRTLVTGGLVTIPPNAVTRPFGIPGLDLSFKDTATEVFTVHASAPGLLPAETTVRVGAATALELSAAGPFVGKGACAPMTVTTTDQQGAPFGVTRNALVNLGVTAGHGRFYSDPACHSGVTTATVASAGDHIVVYFSDAFAEAVTLRAQAALVPGRPPAVATVGFQIVAPTLAVLAGPSPIVTGASASVTVTLVALLGGQQVPIATGTAEPIAIVADDHGLVSPRSPVSVLANQATVTMTFTPAAVTAPEGFHRVILTATPQHYPATSLDVVVVRAQGATGLTLDGPAPATLGRCSGPYTVRTVNASGSVVPVGLDLRLELGAASASGLGVLFQDDQCASAATGPTVIALGQAEARFWVRDLAAERLVVNARGTMTSSTAELTMVGNAVVTVAFIPDWCSDGVLDFQEGDVDCGGSCPPCADGRTCQTETDCASNLCDADHTCGCGDGQLDDGETGIDCGGPACDAIGRACPNAERCATNADCLSTFCNLTASPSTCTASSCPDGQKDGTETDVDCGGGCGPCPTGSGCGSNRDCLSSLCSAGTCVPSCVDGLRDGDESDVDCGGSCAPCDDSKACGGPTDCRSSLCDGTNHCACGDGKLDDGESDIDCGGATCDALGRTCDDSKACSMSADCRSTLCNQGACACGDGIHDGGETGVDCGGATCDALGRPCSAAASFPLVPTALALEGPSAIAGGRCAQLLLALTAPGPSGTPVRTVTTVNLQVQLAPTVAGTIFGADCLGGAITTVTLAADTDSAPLWVKVNAAGTLGLTATGPTLAPATSSIQVAAPGTPAALSLIGANSQLPGDCRRFDIGLVDAAGQSASSRQATRVTLEAGSGSASFFVDRSCNNPVTGGVVTVSRNATGVSVYVADAALDAGTLRASAPALAPAEVTVHVGGPTALQFVVTRPLVGSGACVPITVQMTDEGGALVDASRATTVTLGVTGGGGFSSSNPCRTAVTATTVPIGQDHVDLYFSRSTPGPVTLRAQAALAANLPPAVATASFRVVQPPQVVLDGPSPIVAAVRAPFTVTLADLLDNQLVPVATDVPERLAVVAGDYGTVSPQAPTIRVDETTTNLGYTPVAFTSAAGFRSVLLTATPRGVPASSLGLIVVSAHAAAGLRVEGPSLEARVCSGPYTVRTVDASGLPANVGVTLNVELGGSRAGVLFLDSQCATSAAAAVIAPGQGGATFYIQDPVVETLVVNARGTLNDSGAALTVLGNGAFSVVPPAVSCTNGFQDGDETDVDCGGGTCGGCADGRICAVPADCQSAMCDGSQRCVCGDGLLDNGETDVDCGGAACVALGRTCPAAALCSARADCASTFCDFSASPSVCRASSCPDGQADGTETDVDCGGAACPRCGLLLRCRLDTDCASNACAGGLCVARACGDGRQNGNETDVDCGGSCGPCDEGRACAKGSDCRSAVCDATNHCLCLCPTLDACHGPGTCNGDGTCSYPEQPDGTTCGVHDACRGVDTCVSGLCMTGALLSCDDGNACTTDSCDPLTGCQHAATANACDDGNVCTTGDVCAGGACVGTPCAGAPHATPACRSSGCGITCDGGFADCNQDLADGCEAATATDVANCGACGTACAPGETCSNGGCVPALGACTESLAYAGKGDFDISFDVNVPRFGAHMALAGQRESCTGGSLTWWTARMGTDGAVEWENAGFGYENLRSAGISAGHLHHVGFRRDAGVVSTYVDGVVGTVKMASGTEHTTDMIPLQIGTSPCINVDGTQPLSGMVTNVCIRHQATFTVAWTVNGSLASCPPDVAGLPPSTVTITGAGGGAPFTAQEPCAAGHHTFTGVAPGSYTISLDLFDPGQPAATVTATTPAPVTIGANGGAVQMDLCLCPLPDACHDPGTCGGACSYPAKADGTTCGGSDACHSVDTCVSGVCTQGTPLSCDDGSSCSADTCDPQTGCQHAAIADGTACNDANACPSGDVCVCAGGACVIAGAACRLEAPPACGSRVNLLRNPGFEVIPQAGGTDQGLMPSEWDTIAVTPDTWSNDGSYGVPPDAYGDFTGVTAHGGLRWVAGWSNGGNPETFGQTLSATLRPGHRYRIEAWLHMAVRPDLAYPGGYEVHLVDATPATTDVVVGTFCAQGQPAWERRSFEVDAPASAASLPILVFVPVTAGGGSSYPGLDDVVLEDVTSCGACGPGVSCDLCVDGVRDGSETDVDCGGGECPTCAAGGTCAQGTDCATGACTGTVTSGTTGRCAATTLAFAPARSWPVAGGVLMVAAGDLDGDALPDLVVPFPWTSTVSVCRNDGTGGFPACDAYVETAANASTLTPFWVALGAFRSGGSSDLAIGYGGEAGGGVGVRENHGDGTFGPRADLPAFDVQAGNLVVADFDGDGRLDFAGLGNDGKLRILTGNGDGTFAAGFSMDAYLPNQFIAGDFDGDGTVDVALTSSYNGDLHFYPGAGHGALGGEVTFPSGAGALAGLAAGPLQGPGSVDFVVAQYGGRAIIPMFQIGNSWVAQPPLPLGGGAESVAAVDLDGDGLTDLLATNGAGVVVFRGTGGGAFGPAQFFPAGPDASFVVVADVDGDGRPDLIVANPAAISVTVLMNASH